MAAALLAVALVPLPGGSASSPQPVACRGRACHPAVSAQRWTTRLAGAWAVGGGLTGTVPLSGQAYVAVGDSVAAVGNGLTVEAYALHDGQPLWKLTLTSFRPGSAIISVRAWTGVVTVGVTSPAAHGGAAPGGDSTARSEVVIDNVTGVELRRYPAALFGGAVAASASATTVIGPAAVTSYDNGSGRVRWRRPVDAGLAWRADGSTLYLANSAGGSLRGSRVQGLQIINLISGAQRSLSSPAAFPFTGALAGVVQGVALFSSAGGITAYSGSTGGMLWSMRAVVPVGADPAEKLLYLTSANGSLIGVDPLTGKVRHSVSGATSGGAAGMYVVRGGVVLGLDNGASGEAWGYSLAAGRVTWTAPGLPWPHYFADVSGIGGSAAQAGSTVVIVACQRLAPPAVQSPPPSPAQSPTVTLSPAATLLPAATPPSGTAPARGRRASPASRGRANGATAGAPASQAASPSTSPAASPAPAPSPPRICAAPVLVALSI